MFKKLKTILPLGLLLIILLLPIFHKDQSLQKGQVIKQFFAYSITESLAKAPFHWLSTTLPCLNASNSQRVWVEEPPIFHFISSGFLKFFPESPAIFPIINFYLLAFSLFFLIKKIWPKNLDRHFLPVVLAGVLASPIHLRYSIQHLPDPFALTLFVIGLTFLQYQKLTIAIIFFMFAVTTKALLIFAFIPVFIYELFIELFILPQNKLSIKRNQVIRFIGICGFISLPFLAWIIILNHHEIPNPFRFQNILENRHSGNVGLIFETSFWARFFTWNAAKGAGPILFIGALCKVFLLLIRLIRMQRCFALKSVQAPFNFKNFNFNEFNGFVIFWALGLIPFWIFVRHGNFVHDYYSIIFTIPLSLLGLSFLFIDFPKLMHFPLLKNKFIPHASRDMGKYFGLFLIIINIILGALSLTQLQPIPIAQNNHEVFTTSDKIELSSNYFKPVLRPLFCEKEL